MPKRTLSRRLATQSLVAATASFLSLDDNVYPIIATQAEATSATPVTGEYAAQVDAGLAYFRRRADDQLPLVNALREAIASGDLETARQAYVASRPPYEEIEVLAANFPETDEAIDARPYAFDDGEQSPDFKGFHRIEILLYRDDDLAAALPVANELVATIEQLQRDLATRDNFSAAGHFDGIIALANEVASKKISSEEETWSDQSMLIFRHNWIGIWSQYEPFAPEVRAIDQSIATEAEAAYRAAMTLADAAFEPGSMVALPYSGVPVPVRRELVAASYRLRDALVAARETLGLAV